MFSRLPALISKYWLFVILAWVVILVAVRATAPSWDAITQDGDFAYLPDDYPSVRGQELLNKAFPEDRTKSQLVFVIARPDAQLDLADRAFADRLARHFHNIQGSLYYEQALVLQDDPQDTATSVTEDAAGDSDETEAGTSTRRELLENALTEFKNASTNLIDAGAIDESFAPAIFNESLALAALGRESDAQAARELALRLAPSLADRDRPAPDGVTDYDLVGVWSRYTPIVDDKLASDDGRAQLVVLRLPTEFMALQTVGQYQKIMEDVERFRREAKAVADESAGEEEDTVAKDVAAAEPARPEGPLRPGLVIGVTGSAAVGSNMMLAAQESIESTEFYTVALVIIILLLVYRSPLLVAVPLMSIAISLLVSESLVAAATQIHLLPGMEWWDFKVFKTTKIFITVILFGAGTDYCLFLISRYKEELAAGYDPGEATARALANVGDALVASAMTTILGLGMMFFADFGKFRNSGPAIGLCLLVALLTCVTLAPAILRAFGSAIFWPFGIRRGPPKADDATPGEPTDNEQPRAGERLWTWIADWLLRAPATILLVSVLLLAPFAWFGMDVKITYNFLGELPADRESRQGTALFRQHFSAGESGPVSILAHRPDEPLSDSVGMRSIESLTDRIAHIQGVKEVRSLAEPLGLAVTGDADATSRSRSFDFRKRSLRQHPITKSLYLAQEGEYAGQVTRLEVILEEDPFSLEAVETLNRIDQALKDLSRAKEVPGPVPTPAEIAAEGLDPSEVDLDPSSKANSVPNPWHDAEFAYSGTTAAIRDLARVTKSDQTRIQVLVVAAVFIVLIVILKKPVTCVYMMASVLFSYFVTIGMTQIFFQYAYGDTYEGLDWKAPIFLFVILVAIGEDYNIYLATRVFEEQKRLGRLGGLRRAVVQTGAIITSCGLIMAGTFISMTSGTLRAIVELGVALSLGVMLDTFVVRPILLPAFMAIMARGQSEPDAQASEPEPEA